MWKNTSTDDTIPNLTDETGLLTQVQTVAEANTSNRERLVTDSPLSTVTANNEHVKKVYSFAFETTKYRHVLDVQMCYSGEI